MASYRRFAVGAELIDFITEGLTALDYFNTPDEQTIITFSKHKSRNLYRLLAFVQLLRKFTEWVIKNKERLYEENQRLLERLDEVDEDNNFGAEPVEADIDPDEVTENDILQQLAEEAADTGMASTLTRAVNPSTDFGQP
ncbi:hypothetical protein HK405_015399 [Cladochytrium tenue]|nr:hypothetical protein HK405_015399 [Cladochytrium tenue]